MTSITPQIGIPSSKTPGKATAFRLGSEWRTRGGWKAMVVGVQPDELNILHWHKHDGDDRHYAITPHFTSGRSWAAWGNDHDLIEPWKAQIANTAGKKEDMQTSDFIEAGPAAMHKPFFFVWNPNSSAPKQKHATEQEARAEAERLAAKHPGQDFIVLRSVATCRTKDVGWTEHGKGA